MGKGGGSPKQRVTEYNMSIHFGICQGPVDTLSRIRVNEKVAWLGARRSNGDFRIDNKGLFGGIKKEGGVQGQVYWRKGDFSQTLPEKLAQKLGLTSATAPGMRGIAHAFFTDNSVSSQPGFYWSANQPFIAPLDFLVTRIADSWNPDQALIAGIPNFPLAASLTIDDSGSMGDDGKVNTMKTAVNLALNRIRGAISFNDLKIDIHIAKWGDSGVVSERTYPNATAANINSAKSFINGFNATSGGTDFNEAATRADTFMRSTLGKDLGARVWLFLTDGQPTGGSLAAATATAADMLSPSSGDFNSAAGTAVGAFGVNIQDLDINATAALDNTGIDGIPVIAQDDPAGLLNVIQRAIFGGSNPDVNPAHIIYECLTNTKYGMGAPISQIDDTAFRAAAETLFFEGFGLSMIWVEQTEIENFVQEVLDHIEANLYVDPATGKFVLKLIRNDYDEATLPVFDESNSVVTSYSRRSPAEIINEINVTWTNPDNEKEEVVTIQDLGGIVQSNGQIISDNRNYYGVRRKDLAWAIAQRDISAVTARLATVQMDVNRQAYNLAPGAVFKLTSTEHGATDEVMRVVKVDYGKPGDSTVQVNATQDIFSFERPVYEIPPDGEFDGGGQEPELFDTTLAFTLPYFLTGYFVTATSLQTAAYPDVWVGILASTTNTDAIEAEFVGPVLDPAGNVTQEPLGTRSVVSRGLMPQEMVQEAETILPGFSDLTVGSGPTQGGFGLIADPGTPEEEAELVMFRTFDGTNWTIARGILDTVPRAWPSGTRVHFFGVDTSFVDQDVRSATETLTYKVLMRTSLGQFNEASAPDINYTTNERPHQPSRPANAEIEGVAFADVDASTGGGDITVTWSNRNRITEDSQVMAWDDPGITPEVGQTVKITIRDASTNLVETEITGITGETYDIPRASFGSLSRAIVIVTAERDGFESFQGIEQFITLAAGYGFGYGLSYGG